MKQKVPRQKVKPHIQWILWGSLLGIQRPSREANRLLPSSAQVKNNCTSRRATPHVFVFEQVKLYSVTRQDTLIPNTHGTFLGEDGFFS